MKKITTPLAACALMALLAVPLFAVDVSTFNFSGCAFPDTGLVTSTYSEDDGWYLSTASSMSFTVHNGSAWGGAATSSVTVDNRTGLMWVTNTLEISTGAFNWETALNKCEGLSYAGFADWRLPNVKELYTLTDFNGVSGPYINRAAFMNVQSGVYWTGTTYQPITTWAWQVDFSGPIVSRNIKTIATAQYIICVRGGP